jgi:predicted RNA binding protein YcfA (HicA-like mRNA interferase family)
MPSLPRITGKEAVAAFGKLGFALERVRGSHHVLKKPGHKFALAVPIHGNKPLRRGTLASLVHDAGVSTGEFLEALD